MKLLAHFPVRALEKMLLTENLEKTSTGLIRARSAFVRRPRYALTSGD